MQKAEVVAAGAGFAVRTVTCTDDHARWSPAEARGGHTLVLPRRGRFRRLVDGVAVDLDPTVGYVTLPGGEERFAHPSGGDVCTAISMSAALWHDVAGDRRPRAAVYVDARLDLAHRRLLRAAGDRAEELVTLLGWWPAGCRRRSCRPMPAARPPTASWWLRRARRSVPMIRRRAGCCRWPPTCRCRLIG
ncbi:hypothetical protein [Asanoa sp. NPDC050611]|uniref:hypothetical protein n=1 Tax=Asanoa sp. NPDC050611 TaxID=3157098 RepID=UPI0033DFAFE9